MYEYIRGTCYSHLVSPPAVVWKAGFSKYPGFHFVTSAVLAAIKYEAMKYLIKLQREGWYFAGFIGPSGKAEIGRIHEAKVYYSEREALNDLSRMGHYGQKIISMTELNLQRRGNRINLRRPGSLHRKI